MKRVLLDVVSAPLPASLKRRPSSMFSISTVVDDDGESDTALPLLCNKHIVLEDEIDPATPVTEVSSGQDGLFLEEDDDEKRNILSSTTDAKISINTPLRESDSGFLPCAVEISIGSSTKRSATTGCLRTGIVHEAGFGHFDRSNGYHKERPSRVSSIMEALTNDTDGLLKKCTVLRSCTDFPLSDFLKDEDYLRVHLPGYMQRLSILNGCSCTQLDCESLQYRSVFLTDQSTLEAKRAASSLCSLVSKVIIGKLDNGFAIIRPPGHHAEPGLAGGYCLINNVAVAASYARAKLGVSKVLIVDFDVHHGQGTQKIFFDDPNVMYFSVHRWHAGNYYPFLQGGGPTAVGTGPGTGYNVNVGWTRKGMGDEEYFAVWERLLIPMAHEFRPDLILISSGFDGAAGDMGECDVSPECFGLLTGALMSLGHVVCALEGGYVRSVLQACVKNVVRFLLDPESPHKYKECEQQASVDRQGLDILDTIEPSAANCIRATIQAHQPYWKCLRMKTE